MKPKDLSKKQMSRLQFRNSTLQESSIQTYGYAVRSYFKFLLENGYDEQFDIAQVREWLRQYHNAYTYNIRFQGIKEFYMRQYSEKSAIQRLKVREAFESIKRMKPAREKLHGLNYLTLDQITALASAASDRVSCYVWALFWTGCRITELVNIRLTDCISGDPLTIRVIGKGMRERYVYMPASDYRRILRVFEGTEYLFETIYHTKHNRKRISDEVTRQARQKLGLNVHAHTLRHSKAMYLLERGLSPDKIARALGHANVTTTLSYYLHGTPSAEEQGMSREKTA